MRCRRCARSGRAKSRRRLRAARRPPPEGATWTSLRLRGRRPRVGTCRGSSSVGARARARGDGGGVAVERGRRGVMASASRRRRRRAPAASCHGATLWPDDRHALGREQRMRVVDAGQRTAAAGDAPASKGTRANAPAVIGLPSACVAIVRSTLSRWATAAAAPRRSRPSAFFAARFSAGLRSPIARQVRLQSTLRASLITVDVRGRRHVLAHHRRASLEPAASPRRPSTSSRCRRARFEQLAAGGRADPKPRKVHAEREEHRVRLRVALAARLRRPPPRDLIHRPRVPDRAAASVRADDVAHRARLASQLEPRGHGASVPDQPLRQLDERDVAAHSACQRASASARSRGPDRSPPRPAGRRKPAANDAAEPVDRTIGPQHTAASRSGDAAPPQPMRCTESVEAADAVRAGATQAE